MDGTTYQELCSRTECDQAAAKDRMALGYATHHAIQGPSPRHGDLTAIRLNHGAFGIAKEAGEILSLLEKWVYYGKQISREELQQKVKDELGDVMWYAALVASAMGLDLGEVMEANIRKLQARYPDKYTPELALHRDRAKEAEAVSGSTSSETAQPTVDYRLRTMSQVLAQRKTVVGCCSNFADHIACGCLQDAMELERSRTKSVVQDGHGFSHTDGGWDDKG